MPFIIWSMTHKMPVNSLIRIGLDSDWTVDAFVQTTVETTNDGFQF